MIVRLFEPAPGTGLVPMRGLVEDVRTGASTPFEGGDELLHALAQAADLAGAGPPAPGEDTGENLERNCWS